MKKLSINDSKKKVRINKFLSEIGYCSRREADKLVDSKKISVNGKVITMGTKITPTDKIEIDGIEIEKKRGEKVYIAFNKPKGIVCTTNTKVEKNNIIDYINYPKRIFPIGRLDKLSEGLILLTNDGDILNKILRSRNNHDKEYIVTLNKSIKDDFINKMSKGLPILGRKTKKCFVKKIDNNKFKIILTEGLNRQIRRMCEYLNYRVVKLKRVRIMNINLDLDIGKHRLIKGSELKKLNKLTENSDKEFN
ncbi:MAG: pseudouridine synthase [Flavobacteriaceae bacterium]|tara:strand:- start:2 stop:751 length:750 start_codon:yes stop_codon:yes gene_type:complete